MNQDIPIIVVQDRDDGRVRHLGSNFRFSLGLRIVFPAAKTNEETEESSKDALGGGEGSVEALEQESRNKKFEYRFCGSTFCTADEDAEERVAMIASEEQEDLELWLSEIERHLNIRGVDATQVDAIISNLRDGDPNGIGMMSLEKLQTIMVAGSVFLKSRSLIFQV